jgi:ribosomal protein L37AE/L43A
MKSSILNYQHPADGWYQIEAKGEHPNAAAGVVQVIDDEAAQSIVNRFNADAKAGTLRHVNEMLIDHEHFSDQPDQETRAYGWLQELKNRDDGIYGRIRWTATGKPAVDGGDYRFFSTEYAPKDVKLLNSEKTRVRPLRLDGLTLTNMNNNRGQKPITNRDMTKCLDCNGDLAKSDEAGKVKCQGCGKTFAGPASGSADKDGKKIENKMKNLLTAMGLSAEASEETALVEWSKIKNRLTSLEPMEEENTTLKNRVKAFDTEQISALLDLHGVKEEKLRNRLTASLTPLKNREERMTALADFGHKPMEAKADKGNQTRLLNRSESNISHQESTATEQEKAQKIRNRAESLKATNPTASLETRWAMATQEIESGK